MKTIYSVAFLALLSINLFAADCGCDFTIKASSNKSGVNILTASNFPKIKGGDVVCIEAGKYSAFRFIGFKGSVGKPIKFINCGGKVEVDAVEQTAIEFQGSQYIHFTGTGDPKIPYGIKVLRSKNVPGDIRTGFNARDLSSDFEVDHLEIQNTGFAGLMMKTDPDCANNKTWKENFTMKNLKVHHNWLHNIGGEGIYIGNTKGYEFTDFKCTGIPVFSHLIEDVWIYDNIVEKTGWDGIQVNKVVKNVNIYNNTIIDFGTKNEKDQNFGFSIGGGTRGKIYNNKVITTSTNVNSGSSMQMVACLGNFYVYNNLIVNSGDYGIFVHNRNETVDLNTGYYFINNTIVKTGRSGILYNGCVPIAGCRPTIKNGFYNNLIVNPGSEFEKSNFWKKFNEDFLDFNDKGERDGADMSNNVFSKKISDIKFANAAKDDYSLLKGSIAIDKGKDVSSYGITEDIDGNPRKEGSKVDAGAYEYSTTTGIGFEENESMSYYPNPAGLSLDFKLATSGDAIVKILKPDGAVVKEVSVETVNGKLSIKISELPTGMYFGVIEINGSSKEFKFIKE